MRKKTLIDGKIIVLLALLIRLWGIRADLPYVYHPDEPHHLNVAARFGTGDLNPHDFKYPTLWPYVLSVMLGVQYAVATVFRVVSSSHEFAVLFLRSPTAFYAGGRILAALGIALGIGFLHRTALKYGSRPLALVVGLIACFTPLFVHYGSEATPYGLMVFLLCAAIYTLHDAKATGSKRAYILSGLFLGLATSCHYTAGVFGAWLVALHFTRTEKNHRYLALGLLMCAVGFFIGTPFALFDANTFFGSLIGLKNSQDTATWNVPVISGGRIVDILKNLVFYLEDWGLGFLLAVIGFVSLSREKKWEYVAWLSPVFVVFPFLAVSTFGASMRYLMGSFLILIFLTAYGFLVLWNLYRAVWFRALLSAALFIPLIWATLNIKHEMMRPDTRTLAMEWLLEKAPVGTKIFISDPFYGPQPQRSRAQIERLLKRTEELNHPRKDYFRYLLEGDRGGGYEIYYLRRTVQEIWDIPERVEPAYQAQDWFDMEKSSLNDVKKEGVRYIIVDEHMLKKRADSLWLKDLQREYPVAAEFHQGKGPRLWIYDLSSKNPPATKKPSSKA